MLEVSEIFASIQGEGPLVGTPSVFLRTRRCNLRCSWCDTKYTWDRDDPGYANFDYLSPGAAAFLIGFCANVGVPHEMRAEYVERYQEPQSWDITHLVITGGEPLIWRRELRLLLEIFINSKNIHTVEVETNGTISPHLTRRLEEALGVRYNVSPKLMSAGNKGLKVWRPEVLRDFAGRDSCFKFVFSGDPAGPEGDELRSCLSFLRGLGVPESRLYLMPEGTRRAAVEARVSELAALASVFGARVTNRRQIIVWGDRRGT